MLTLEEVFGGNDVVGSILCNVVLGETFDTPTPQHVRDWFPKQLAPGEVLDAGDREFEDIAQPREKFRACWWD